MDLLVVMMMIVMATGALELASADGVCGDGFYGTSGGICCQLCPAGSFLITDCTIQHEVSTCEVCPDGYFMDDPNYFPRCLKCTHCQPEEDTVRTCNATTDVECRCKPGFHKPDGTHFCRPILVSRTTPSIAATTTIPPDSSQRTTAGIVIAVLILAAAATAVLVYKKMKKKWPWQHCNPIRKTDAPDGQEGSISSAEMDLFLPETQRPQPGSSTEINSTQNGTSDGGSTSNQASTHLPQLNKVTPEDKFFSKYNRVIKGEEANEVHQTLRENDLVKDYRGVMRNAGLMDNYIQEAEVNNSGNVNEMNFDMLKRWLQRDGSRATYANLLKALEKSGYKRTMERLMAMCDKLNETQEDGCVED